MSSDVIRDGECLAVPDHPRTESMIMEEGEIRPRPDEVAETEDT
jgi:hypothetical protein